MKTTWPELGATLASHTVKTARGAYMAGFLVRCLGSRKELGYIWTAGTVWCWQTPSGENHGERSTQRKAIEVLRDAHDLARGGARLPFDIPTPTDADILDAWRSVGPLPRLGSPMRPQAPTPRASASPTPAPAAAPVKKIVWNDAAPAFDVSAAIAAGLKKAGA